MGDWNIVIGGKLYQNIIDLRGLGRRNKRDQNAYSLLLKEWMYHQQHMVLASLREDCTPGNHQIEIDVSWITYL